MLCVHEHGSALGPTRIAERTVAHAAFAQGEGLLDGDGQESGGEKKKDAGFGARGHGESPCPISTG